MRRTSLAGCAFLLCVASGALASDDKAKPSAERGRLAVRGQPPLNPAVWSLTAHETVWKRWGVAEKPAHLAAALRERYGLHEPPYENGGLPMGLHTATGLFGKGLGSDCLLCHAGSIAGKTYIGLGNASLDIQGLFDDLPASGILPAATPVRLGNVRGTIEASAVVTYLMELRNPDLSLRLPRSVKVADESCEDVPAWWLMKKKKTMYHTGSGHAQSVRTMMPFLLSPFNGPDHIKKLEPVFADIQAYLLTLEPPRYPFAIDAELAGQGKELFTRTCAKCHGTYGAEARYPSKVIPLADIGTDPSLAEATTPEFANHYLKSWFAQEKGPDGKPFPVQTIRGYQAPPLDGVWATAPYLHNGSVPTIYHVLNSKARPKLFTRSYRTEVADYDAEKLGWKIEVLDRAPDAKTAAFARRKIYDTTQPGRANTGHTYGNMLSDTERRAVIEYLKTL